MSRAHRDYLIHGRGLRVEADAPDAAAILDHVFAADASRASGPPRITRAAGEVVGSSTR